MARHIRSATFSILIIRLLANQRCRKHTGERPFQCHCLRRFSRLDNLRQHAQTVHMNEDIPVDSLAATGTRFQRQIRTERMRTPGNRPRASTLSSGGHSRGHSRNVSGSSIGSISDLASPDSARRAPPPLAMATPIQARPGLSVDTFSASTNVPYYNYAPSGFSTPMSAYSNEAGSPRMSSVLGSPIGMMSRSTIGWGGQNHSRRLSVPSQVNPYHPASQFHTPQAPFMSPMMTPAIPHHSMMQTSPPRDGGHQMLDATEAEWRRRTWHPSSRNSFGSRPATSGLSYQQRPDDPQAVPTTQPAAQQAVRLPGIDSFDRSTLHPSATNRRPTEGMDLDDVSVAVETEPSSKRNSWNSMNQNLNHLELAQNTPPRDPNNWRHSNGSNSSLSTRPPTAPYYNSPSRAPAAPMTVNNPHIDAVIDPALEQQPLPIPATPLRKKRQGLFFNEANTSPGAGEPGPAIRTSPDGSANSEEVHTPSANADYQPAIVHSDGHIERQDMPVVEEQPKVRFLPLNPGERSSTDTNHQQGEMAAQASMSTFGVPQVPSAGPETPEQQRSHDTQRLDALVAVATSEDQVIAQH